MKTIHIVLIVVIVIAVGIIIGTMYNVDTYSNFNEASKNPNKEYQIIGKLDTTKSVDAISNYGYLLFYVTDEKGVQKKVIFKGAKPYDFEKSEKIVMIGKMNDAVFVTNSILLKCPSKFTEKSE